MYEFSKLNAALMQVHVGMFELNSEFSEDTPPDIFSPSKRLRPEDWAQSCSCG
jgi:hypothetical protein